MRVVQPSLLALRVNSFQAYGQFFVATQKDLLLEKFAVHAALADVMFRTWAKSRSTVPAG